VGFDKRFIVGTGGGSEDDIQDSSQPNFNWEDIVNQSSESAAANADNDSENADSGTADVSDDAANDAASLLNDAAATDPADAAVDAAAPTISVRDLGEFRAPAFSGNDSVGQGDTEYMSLERLGETCEVCGERALSRQSLEEHRSLVGHYKCSVPECGLVVGTAGDLTAHQASVHAAQPAMPPQQSPPVAAGPGTPPVQQLAQQVQRLPIPQQQAQVGNDFRCIFLLFS